MSITVGTYNIQHGVLHRHRLATGETKVDLCDVCEVLGTYRPAICALNEIYGDEAGIFGNQPRQMAETLGYPYHAFARGIYHKFGEYGNALLSRYPIRDARTIPLSIPTKARKGTQMYEDRALLIATLDVEGKEVVAMVCHFGLNDDEQALAVDTILAEAARITVPILLMGDFNLTPDTAHYRRLAAAFTDTARGAASPTFPSEAPQIKIDYVFTKGCLTVAEALTPAAVASDHLPIFTTLKL